MKDLLVREKPGKWRVCNRPVLKDEEGKTRLRAIAKVFSWFETFLKIRTKSGSIEPFHMNASQIILSQFVAERHYLGLPVEVVQVKCRQHGSSTYWIGLNTALCELRAGHKVSTIAHDERAAGAVFGKLQTFLRQLDRTPWGKPDLVEEQRLKIVWESESSNQAGTIKTGDALGKGESINVIHYTESANFTDKGVNAHKATASIQQGVATDRWRMIIHESTANGKDGFFWPLAEDARDPNSGSTMQLLFIPWFLTPEYSMTWASYCRKIVESGGNHPGKFELTTEEISLKRRLAEEVVTDQNRRYRYNYRLKNSQLVWRRWAVKNLCNGDPDEFKRYYPSFYEEAFTASASSMFSAQTIDWYRKQSGPPKARGRLVDGEFYPDEEGAFKVWQWPRTDGTYVLSADVGGDKPGSDPSAGYVINKDTLEVCAQIHGHFEWDHFADHLIDLGEFFNFALLVVENNHNPATVKRLHRKGYRNLYYYFVAEKAEAKRGPTPGFNTNRGNRRGMLKRLARHCRDKHLVCPDAGLWREMESFVWVPKSGSDNPDRDGDYRAVGGNHDDRIMALAIGLNQCPDHEDLPEIQDEEVQDVGPAYRDYLKFERELAEQNARPQNEGGYFL